MKWCTKILKNSFPLVASLNSFKVLFIAGSMSAVFTTATTLQAAAGSPITTENALRVLVNVDGFDAISKGVSDRVLTEIIDAPLDDMDENVGYGIQAKLSSMTYSIKFKKFDVTLGQGKLLAVVQFDEIKVKVPTAHFTKNIGTIVSTTCRNTNLTVGSNSSVALSMQLEPQVQGEKIILTPSEISFPLPAEEFLVDGPESCTGSLGVGRVISYAMNRALSKSRDKIAAAIESKVRDVIPSMADTLNQMITREIPVALGHGESLPLKNLVLSTHPYQVSVTPERALFALSIDVREGNPPPSLGHLTNFRRSFGEAIELGSFGVRTAFINEMIAKAMPALPATIAVSAESSIMREIFSRRGLSSIIPDINTVEMDSDFVSARIGFDRPPEIRTTVLTDGSAFLRLDISQMHLFLDITQNGHKVPYFELLFNATLGVQLSITNGQLTFNLAQPTHIEVDGRWAEGYTPNIPLFERDVAQTIFFTALDIICNGGILARMDVPEFRLSANQVLTLASPHVDSDFVAVKLVSH